jgi:MFS family permease
MLAALLGEFMQSLILTGLESILPLRIKTLFDYNSMQVALVFLSLSFSTFVGPFVGHVSDRIGAKIMVCLGFGYAAPLMILLRLVDHDGITEVILLCCLLLLLGIALNMILTPVWSEVSYLVDAKVTEEPGVFGNNGAYAQAFSLMNVAYASGSLVGPLTGSLLVEMIGWNDITLATGILCALCVLPCLFATGGKRVQKRFVRTEGEVDSGSL